MSHCKKRTGLALLVCFLFPAGFLFSEPKDLIVIVDTSTGMGPYYAAMSQFLTGPFLEDNLELGDTFHLLSFGGKPRFEIARRILGEGDVQTIIGRMLLLYPLEPFSDLKEAVTYCERYVGTLPAQRQKSVFIFSANDEQNALAASRLNSGGVTANYMKLPLSGLTARNRPAREPPSTPANNRPVREPPSPPANNRPVREPASPPANNRPVREPASPPANNRPSENPPVSGVGTVRDRPPVLPRENPLTGSENVASGPEADLTADGIPASAPESGIPESGAPDSAGSFPERKRADKKAAGSASPERKGADKKARERGSWGIPDIAGLVQFPFVRILLVLAVVALIIPGFIIMLSKLRRLNASPNKTLAAAAFKDKPAEDTELLNRFAGQSASSELSGRSFQDDSKRFHPNPPLLSLFAGERNTQNETPAAFKDKPAGNTERLNGFTGHSAFPEPSGRSLRDDPERLRPKPSLLNKTLAFKDKPAGNAEGLNGSAGHSAPEPPGRFLRDDPARLRPKPSLLNKTLAFKDKPAGNAERANAFTGHGAPEPSGRLFQDDPNQFLANPPLLNLFVEDQNTAIGRRNVHTLKAGTVFSVGGGKSDFLIFLVPLPYRIGELRFDGTSCTFVPLKPGYFPDIASRPVPACIGKTIRVRSDMDYELYFHFERFKDPLIELNRLLNSLRVPQAPGI